MTKTIMIAIAAASILTVGFFATPAEALHGTSLPAIREDIVQLFGFVVDHESRIISLEEKTTLSDVPCTVDQIAKFDGTQWNCSEDLTGTIDSSKLYVKTNTISHDDVVRDDWSVDCNGTDIAISGGAGSSMDQAHLIVNTAKVVNGIPIGWKAAIVGGTNFPQPASVDAICLSQ